MTWPNYHILEICCPYFTILYDCLDCVILKANLSFLMGGYVQELRCYLLYGLLAGLRLII
jgi:hypothetical protein